MRIVVMDNVFNYDGLGAIVARHVPNPASHHITPEQVVAALHKEQKEEGVSKLFHNCTAQFSRYDEEKRLEQLAEGAFYSYKILKAKGFDAAHLAQELKPIRENAEKYEALFRTIACDDESKTVVKETPVEQKWQEVRDAERWFASHELSLAEIEKLAADEKAIEKMHEKTKEFAKEYVKKNGLSTHDGKKLYKSKSLHGVPFDQNRLGKIGEVELTYSDGSSKRKSKYHPGFEDFYISGSSIALNTPQAESKKGKEKAQGPHEGKKIQVGTPKPRIEVHGASRESEQVASQGPSPQRTLETANELALHLLEKAGKAKEKREVRKQEEKTHIKEIQKEEAHHEAKVQEEHASDSRITHSRPPDAYVTHVTTREQ